MCLHVFHVVDSLLETFQAFRTIESIHTSVVHQMILIVLPVDAAVAAEFAEIDPLQCVRSAMQCQHMRVPERFVALGTCISIHR